MFDVLISLCLTISVTRINAAAAGDGTDLPTRIMAELDGLIRHRRRQMTMRWSLTDVSTTHLHVLMVLDSDGPVPMGRLAQTLLCSDPNATGIIDRMEERRLVERIRDERDRRVVHVRITDEGRRTLEELQAFRERHMKRIFEHMPPADQRLCLRAFRTIRRTAELLQPENDSAGQGSAA